MMSKDTGPRNSEDTPATTPTYHQRERLQIGEEHRARLNSTTLSSEAESVLAQLTRGMSRMDERSSYETLAANILFAVASTCSAHWPTHLLLERPDICTRLLIAGLVQLAHEVIDGGPYHEKRSCLESRALDHEVNRLGEKWGRPDQLLYRDW